MTPGVCCTFAITWVGPEGDLGSSNAGKPSLTRSTSPFLSATIHDFGFMPSKTTFVTSPLSSFLIISEKVIPAASDCATIIVLRLGEGIELVNNGIGWAFVAKEPPKVKSVAATTFACQLELNVRYDGRCKLSAVVAADAQSSNIIRRQMNDMALDDIPVHENENDFTK